MPKKTKNPDLSVIILNYKTPKLTCDCLRSIYKSKTENSFEIIVLDNNSQDNSQKLITKEFPHVIFLQEKTNHGFSRGNNIAARRAKGEYLLFLNSDTLIFQDTIEKALNRIKKDSGIGALGSKILNPDRTIQRSVYAFPSLKLLLAEMFFLPNLGFNGYRYFKHDKEKYVDFVSGTFVLIKKSLFRQLNGFDEDYFIYLEDVDLCKRIKKKGYKILFYPDTSIIHFGGNSIHKFTVNKTFFESQSLYIKKNISPYKLAFFMLFIKNAARALIFSLKKDKFKFYFFLCTSYYKELFKRNE